MVFLRIPSYYHIERSPQNGIISHLRDQKVLENLVWFDQEWLSTSDTMNKFGHPFAQACMNIAHLSADEQPCKEWNFTTSGTTFTTEFKSRLDIMDKSPCFRPLTLKYIVENFRQVRKELPFRI